MKKVSAILFLIIFHAIQVIAQEAELQLMPFDKNKRLELKLLDSEIVANSNGFNLNISITNRTDSIFILYGFNDIGCGGAREENYRQANITAGSEIYVLDKRDKRICLDINGEKQRLLRPGFRHTWKAAVDLTYNSRIVAPAKSAETINIPIKLQSKPKKGTYKLRMFYYSGVNIVNIIDKETIVKDQKEVGAVLFQGFVESVSVKLKFK